MTVEAIKMVYAYLSSDYKQLGFLLGDTLSNFSVPTPSTEEIT